MQCRMIAQRRGAITLRTPVRAAIAGVARDHPYGPTHPRGHGPAVTIFVSLSRSPAPCPAC